MTRIDKIISDPKQLQRLGASLIRSGKCGWKQYAEFTFRDERGDRIIFSDHQAEWFDFIDRKLRTGFNKIDITAPWGHTKTQSISLFYPSWNIGNNPHARCKIISAKDSVAIQRVVANRLTIDDNEDFQAIFPHVKPGDKWGEQAFRIKGASIGSTDYTMEGYGVGSGRMGGRADLMIFDDVCDLDNSLTEDQREKTKNKIEYQWLSRLAPNGIAIAIRTPWHREDAMEQVTKTWQKLQIKVSEDIDCLEVYENGVLTKRIPLWEPHWGADKLKEIRKENYKRFNMGYRLIPASDEDATFKYLDKAIRWNTDPMDYEYVGYWGGFDLSTKTRSGTVGVIGGITHAGQRVIIDIIYLDDPIKIKSVLWDWRNKYGDRFNFVNVENNAIQDAVVDIIKGEHILPIRGFMTGKNKTDPYIGLPVLDVSFENGSLIIPVPHANTECDCSRCRLIRAFRLHPYASETDSVMATWFCERAMMNYKRQVFA